LLFNKFNQNPIEFSENIIPQIPALCETQGAQAAPNMRPIFETFSCSPAQEQKRNNPVKIF
jgi:hypothetical protein